MTEDLLELEKTLILIGREVNAIKEDIERIQKDMKSMWSRIMSERT